MKKQKYSKTTLLLGFLAILQVAGAQASAKPRVGSKVNHHRSNWIRDQVSVAYSSVDDMELLFKIGTRMGKETGIPGMVSSSRAAWLIVDLRDAKVAQKYLKRVAAWLPYRNRIHVSDEKDFSQPYRIPKKKKLHKS